MLNDQDFREPAIPFAASLEQIEDGYVQSGGLTVRDVFTAVAIHAMLSKWLPPWMEGDAAALEIMEDVGENAIIVANAAMRSRAERHDD